MNPMAMYQMFANLQQHASTVAAPFGPGAPVNANGGAPGQESMKTEEGGKRKRRRGPDKKEKKPRDPNKPKRPPCAYLLFQNEVRKEMQERFPSMAYHDLLSKISERWAHMSDEDKKVRAFLSLSSVNNISNFLNKNLVSVYLFPNRYTMTRQLQTK